MAFRRPTLDERRLLLELAKIGGIKEPDTWVETLNVREMNDGGMGSLELSSDRSGNAVSTGLVICKATVQFTDEDGVEVVASLNATQTGMAFELEVWKTNFAPLIRIPTVFRRVEG